MSDLRSSAPGLYGGLRLVAATITFEDDSVELEDLAVGDVVVNCWADVTEAFDAGDTNVITLGDGDDDDKYLTAANVTEGTAGVTPTGGAGPFPAETAAGTLTVTYAQTGTAATEGAATVYALVTSAPA